MLPMLSSRRHRRRLVYTAAARLRPLLQPPWRQPALICTVVGLTLAVSYLWPAKPPRTTVVPARPTHVVTTSTDHPSEAAVTVSTYHSTATGDQPKYLRLPTIQAQGFVQAVGVDQHRQIAVPTNIHLAGWFTSTVTPGNLGLSIIDGHLDGYRQPGIFAHLTQLKPGDRFTIELATGATRTFQVKTVQALPVAAAVSALFSQLPGVDRQLNLITCGGTFHTANGYDQRIVVASQLVAN